MASSFNRSSAVKTAEELEPVVHDDGGSGLLEAATDRFGPSGCAISCDAKHTVWVKRPDGAVNVGISPWMLNRFSLEELLDRVARKLAG